MKYVEHGDLPAPADVETSKSDADRAWDAMGDGPAEEATQQPDEFPNIGALLTRAMNPVSEGGGGYKNAAAVQKDLGGQEAADIRTSTAPLGRRGRKTDQGDDLRHEIVERRSGYRRYAG